MADNYWSMGIPGPCGPSSEIYYDRGPEYGVEGGPEANEDRYIEIWNLVFMQNERGEGTSKEDFEILGPLPRKNIDTGMGVERVACLLQGVDNVYETDLLRPVIDAGGRRRARAATAQGNHEDDVRYRIIADHSRTAAIIIGDGVSPGNDGRGYVLRRLLRRVIRVGQAARHRRPDRRRPDDHGARRDGPVVPGTGQRLRPDPAHRGGRGDGVQPHARIGLAAVRGGRQRDEGVGRHGAVGHRRVHAARHLRLPARTDPRDGRRGRPVGRRRGLPRPDGRAAPARQGRRGRPQAGPLRSVGIPRPGRRRPDRVHRLQRIDLRGKDSRHLRRRQAGAGGQRTTARRPTESSWSSIAPRSTPSPADRSPTRAPSPAPAHPATAKAAVTDVQKIAKTLWAHRVNVESGEFVEGDTVVAAVDPRWRHGATQGHSGTHMVHAALRQVLGPNAVQAGSLNRPGYLRFDFNWQGALSEDQRTQIEEVTNEAVEADFEVHSFTTDLEKAKSMGAMALFGEAYPDEVRVVEIGGPVLARAVRRYARAAVRRRSGRSRSSANRRSAPACAASRRMSASTRSAIWPRNAR